MNAKRKLSPFTLTLLVSILLIPCVFGFFYTLIELEERERHRSLQNRAQTQFQLLQSAFVEITGVLQALRGVIELKPDISSSEFDAFVASQKISDYGISTFEWIPKVKKADYPQWVEKMRRAGHFNFIASYNAQRQNPRIRDIFPIKYSASSQMQGLSLGTNLAQDPIFSPLLIKALTSSSIQLAIKTPDSNAQLLTNESRFLLAAFHTDRYDYAHLLGYVGASLNFEETINILMGNSLGTLNLCLQVERKTGQTANTYPESGQVLFSNCQKTHGQDSLEIPYPFAGETLLFRFHNLDKKDKLSLISTAQLGILAFFLAAIFGLHSLYQARKATLEIEKLVEQKQARITDISEDYMQLFMLSVDGIYKADLTGNLLEANPAFATAFGYCTNERICQQVTEIQNQLHLSATSHQDFIKRLLAHGKVTNYEWLGVTETNQPVWLTENAYLVKDDQGVASHYQGFISIISERKQAEQSLQYQADYDALTGLRNRASFMRLLDEQIKAHNDGQLAMIFIDIDRFKSINDSYGHAVGDDLLIKFSQRLKNCFSSAQVARFGGDEFALFMPSVTDIKLLSNYCNIISQAMESNFQLDSGHSLSITASIGASLLTAQCLDSSEALLQADLAMYGVKHSGKNNSAIYDLNLSQNIERRLKLEVLLKNALENQEFYLVYQPIVTLSDQSLAGFETLVRWRSAELGEVSPVEFIPVLEELNLIAPIGAWIMSQAIAQLQKFNQLHTANQLFLNINVSPKQLIVNDIASLIKQLTSTHQIPTSQINIEVTETQLYSDGTTLLSQLHSIKAMGVGIYIDDFGTGHSSLERLVNFPLSGIKLDRSFISALKLHSNNAIVLKASVQMAQLLGLKVTAEGIEQQYQQDFFNDLDCLHGQGYLYSNPLSVLHAEQLILNRCTIQLA